MAIRLSDEGAFAVITLERFDRYDALRHAGRGLPVPVDTAFCRTDRSRPHAALDAGNQLFNL